MIRVLDDKVLVEMIDQTMTRGGIVLPADADQDVSKAKVVAIGTGRVMDGGVRMDPQVKPGDVVIFAPRNSIGTKVPGPNGEKYRIVEERFILAILES